MVCLSFSGAVLVVGSESGEFSGIDTADSVVSGSVGLASDLLLSVDVVKACLIVTEGDLLICSEAVDGEFCASTVVVDESV